MNQGEALRKIDSELEKFKKEIFTMEPRRIYNMSGFIIFTEATIYHLKVLTRDENLCSLIMKYGKTLKGAVMHVMNSIRKKYGMSGDISVDEFQKLIWEYYEMKPEEAKKAITIKASNKKGKTEEPTLLSYVNNSETNSEKQDSTNKKTIIRRKTGNIGPLQISLFNLGGESNE